jgi:hypothetical protein
MAGSYEHVTEKDGSLSTNNSMYNMLDNIGDVYETVEEMYGMIWYLANRLDELLPGSGDLKDIVEEARQNYELGISYSPTRR